MINSIFVRKTKESIFEDLEKQIALELTDHLDAQITGELIEHYLDLDFSEEEKEMIIVNRSTKKIAIFDVPFKNNFFKMYINLDEGLFDFLYISRITYHLDLSYLDIPKVIQPFEVFKDKKVVTIRCPREKDQLLIYKNKELLNILNKKISSETVLSGSKLTNNKILLLNHNKLLFSTLPQPDKKNYINFDILENLKTINNIIREITKMSW